MVQVYIMYMMNDMNMLDSLNILDILDILDMVPHRHRESVPYFCTSQSEGRRNWEMLQKIKHIFHLVSCPPLSYEQSKKLTSLLMASPHHVDSVTPTHTNTPQYKYNDFILQIQTHQSTNTNTATQIQMCLVT